MDPDLPASVARQWNVTLETEIFKDTLLRVAYIGDQARHLDQTREFNAQPSGYVWYATTHQPLPTGPYAARGHRPPLRLHNLRHNLPLDQEGLLQLQWPGSGITAALQQRLGVPVVLRAEQLAVHRQRGP